MEKFAQKEEHDRLLSEKPEHISDDEFAEIVAEHQASPCPFCNNTIQPTDLTHEGSDDVKEFTQEEVDAAVKAAVATATAPLQEELDAVKASAASQEAEDAVQSAVEAVRTELTAQIETLTADLETAKVEAAAKAAELADLTSLLEAEQELQEVTAWMEAVKAERLEKIKATVAFDDEFIAANVDRWLQDSEDQFAERLAEWASISAKATAKQEVEEVVDTAAITASVIETVRTPAKAASSDDPASLVASIL